MLSLLFAHTISRKMTLTTKLVQWKIYVFLNKFCFTPFSFCSFVHIFRILLKLQMQLQSHSTLVSSVFTWFLNAKYFRYMVFICSMCAIFYCCCCCFALVIYKRFHLFCPFLFDTCFYHSHCDFLIFFYHFFKLLLLLGLDFLSSKNKMLSTCNSLFFLWLLSFCVKYLPSTISYYIYSAMLHLCIGCYCFVIYLFFFITRALIDAIVW